MLREVLKDKNEISFGKSYSIYRVYFGDTFLGEKHVENDGNMIIHVIKLKPCIIFEANLIVSKFIHTDIFTETIEFCTNKPFSWTFGEQLAQLIEMEKKMAQEAKKYTSLKCIKRYSYNGDGKLDCEMYAAVYSELPCYIVNHFKKEVSACHGYCYSGKDAAKKLGYKFHEY